MAAPRKDFRKAIRLYKRGLSFAKIARQMNPPVTRAAIRQALNRRGFLSHTPRA